MRSHGVIAFVLGMILMIVGFLWGSFFAGVPYTDPTPAQQENYQMHIAIAERLLLVGGMLSFVLAPLLRVIRRWRQRQNHSR